MQVCPFADRVGAGRASGNDRIVRPADTELDRELAARGVDENVRKEERGDPVGPSLEEDLVLSHELVESSDAAAHDDADPLGVVPVHAGVRERLLGCTEREEDVAIEAFDVLWRGEAARIEVLDLPGDRDVEAVGVECLDVVDAASAGDRRLHVEEASLPSGVTTPMPVMATLLMSSIALDGAMTSSVSPKLPFPPMEAELVNELPEGDGWQYEPKWDGFRGILENVTGELHLWSRNGRPLLRYFPELEQLSEQLPPGSALDGEIVIERNGALDFDALQMRLHPAESRVQKLSAEIPADFVAFDVLLWDGEAVHELPLEKRRKRVEKLPSRSRRRPAISPSHRAGSTGSRSRASTG